MQTRLTRADVLVPALLLTLGMIELSQVRPDRWWVAALVEAGAAVLLLWRRRAPLVACSAAAVVQLLMPWAGPQLNDVATPIFFLVLVCYSLGRRLSDLRGLLGIGLILAVTLLDYVAVDTRSHNITDVLFVATMSLPPFVFGRISRRLADQGALIARQAEQLRDQAVREERDRIARELHDVIAHSVSAMVVQTAAAQDLVHSDPDRAAGLLASIAATGRHALVETGRLLHLVRDETDELGLTPAPGLGDVPALVESFRDGGLDVTAELALPTVPLPVGVDVSAYRVVQESLTNALKYAGGPVRLQVDATADTLRISCGNPLGSRSRNGSGLGLLGMAERVGLLGGTLHHGCDADGRFEVDVVLPLAEEGAG